MSNTSIQILRSYVTPVPPELADGELAYSFLSNTMFIGDNAGHIIKIGAPISTENQANTIVLRDESGAINVVVSTVDGGNF